VLVDVDASRRRWRLGGGIQRREEGAGANGGERGVVFFYPTCPYCNAAFPEVQRIYTAYKDRGLSMVWINVITDEEKLIANWQREHGYTVPVLLGDRALAMGYRLRMTPTHYLLDAKGQILSSHAGYKAGDEKELEQSIQKALGL